MRILELHLRPFGLFLDRTLDLRAQAPALQVVYGPNEAGKSTALRAVLGLLFGIPERTLDHFRAPADQLRVAGLLEGADGRVRYLARRKGRKNTLLDADGNPLADGDLPGLLGRIDREAFETLYGLNHERLQKGGTDLCEGKGDLAASLFQGATGIVGIHAKLRKLQEDAERFFTAGSRKKELDNAIAAYKDAVGRMHAAETSAGQWKKLSDTVAGIEKELERRSGEIRGERVALERLKRYGECLAPAKEYARLAADLAALGEVKVLPDDTARRRLDALQRARGAETEAAADRALIQDRQRELDGLPPADQLLAREKEIRDLVQDRLGVHLKAAKDRGGLDTRAADAERGAARILRELSPGLALESARDLQLSLPQRERVRKLALRHGTLAAKHAGLLDDCRQAGEEIDGKELELAQASGGRDTRAIQAVLRDVEEAGAPERARLEAEKKRRKLESDSGAAVRALPFFPADPEALDGLPVPPEATVDRFEKVFAELERRRGEEQHRLDDAQQRLRDLEARRQEVLAGGAIPDEATLRDARETREAGWRLVRRAWLDGARDPEAEAAYGQGRELPEAYERSVADADGVADTLRREADRVAGLARLSLEAGAGQERVAALEEALAETGRREAETAQAWEAAWRPAGIVPRSPAEMRGWLARHREAVLATRQLAEQQEEVARLDRVVDHLRSRLARALTELGLPPDPGESLASLTRHARELVDRERDAAQERALLEQAVARERLRLAELRRRLDETASALAAWEGEWADALRPLKLDPPPGPEAAQTILDRIEDMVKLLDEAADLRRRIAGIDRDAEAFRAEASALAAALAPDLAGLAAEEAAKALRDRLLEAQKARTRREGLEKELDGARKRLAEHDAQAASARARIAELLGQAGCGTPEELEGMERRSEDYLRNRRRLDELGALLAVHAEGLDLPAFVVRLRDMDGDALKADLETARLRIEGMELDFRRVTEDLGRARMELERVNGGPAAADAAVEAQESLAALRDKVDRYLTLRLSAEVLRRAVAHFRESRRAPLLQRAGEHFATVTAGAFASLEVDFDENDNPVLVGVRPPEAEVRRVRVPGMSDGTRDQLYLALRVAGLEDALDAAEPLPVILDDILVNFDDERSRAALVALGRLARKTQVLFFTHHRRMLDLLEDVRSETPFVVHTL
ncbi:MAG: AAA family ATPase [Acidobacteria bacterium]|nr:AAA family ATPase [Acidobacteriota bacterium]